jgi:UDP-N-acetylmuramate--alanine ligase
MNLPQRIYMTGIGGIGMSALAQMLHAQGRVVAGSDRDESPTTALLEKKGIHVDIGQRAENVAAETELLIYSDAVPADSSERVRAKEIGIPEMSYFEALGEISRGMRTVAVAGTHGKTTTTGMLAKILSDADVSPTAVVGSIVRDFESNFLAGESDLFVVEACEYRDHLLKLNPEVLVITNIELDHTDYFPTLEALLETFRTAAHKVPRTGVIICDPAGVNVAQVLAGAQARIVDYTQYAVGSLLLPGEFNRENARAALAAAKAVHQTLSLEAGVHSLSLFKGSWRRFEYKGETPSGALVYDDYAHHPTSVHKTLDAAREKFPTKKIVVAFHPHLYSRTRDFMDAFAQALSKADEVILAPIYAAREEPIEGVTSEVLASKINSLGTPARAFASLHDIFLYFSDTRLSDGQGSTLTADSLLLTMGAGDIYKVAEQIVD